MTTSLFMNMTTNAWRPERNTLSAALKRVTLARRITNPLQTIRRPDDNPSTPRRRLEWLSRAHIAICHDGSPGSQRAIDYCRKDEQSHEQWVEMGIEGPDFGRHARAFSYGARPRQSSCLAVFAWVVSSWRLYEPAPSSSRHQSALLSDDSSLYRLFFEVLLLHIYMNVYS